MLPVRVAIMQADKETAPKPLSGSSVWTIVGWLAFALPLALYLVVRLS
jgi:hypothetical protein